MIHDKDGVNLGVGDVLGGGGGEEEGVAKGNIGGTQPCAGIGVLLCEFVVPFLECAVEELQATALVELRLGVVSAFEELLA